MSDFPSYTHVTVSTELTKEQKARFRALLSATPLSALPANWNGLRQNTTEDVLDAFEHVRSHMMWLYEQLESKDRELDSIKRDLKAAGRLFKLIQDDEQ